jgi:ribosomal protein L31
MFSKKLIRLLAKELHIRFCLKCNKWTEIRTTADVTGVPCDYCWGCGTVYDEQANIIMRDKLLEKFNNR